MPLYVFTPIVPSSFAKKRQFLTFGKDLYKFVGE